MNMKILAVVTCILLVLTTMPSTFAVKGPFINTLQYKFYGNQDSLFKDLMSNKIDLMGSSLTTAQYDQVSNSLNTVSFVRNVEGIDLSNKSNNGNPIDWTKVYGAGKRFALVKVTEGGRVVGSKWIDTKFSYNLLEAWKAGLDVGAYHFAVIHDPAKIPAVDDPVDEANFFVDTAYVSYTGPKTLPPMLDLESIGKPGWYTGTIESWSDFVCDWVLVWLQTVEDRIHIKPIIYVGNKDTMGVLKPSAAFYGLTDYGLWIGWPNDLQNDDGTYSYVGNPQTDPWSNWVYWQYATDGKAIVPGIAGWIDLDKCQFYMSYLIDKTKHKGWLNIVDGRGLGFTSTRLDWTWLMVKHSEQTMTEPTNIIYGCEKPPESLNPLFSTNEVTNSIFSTYINTNPYSPYSGSAITGAPTGGDLPWMAYAWKIYLDTSDLGYVLELWFRNDIKWHDGVKFTVDDLEYTISMYKSYSDSVGYYDMNQVKYFEKIDDYHCKIYFDYHLPSSQNLLRLIAYNILPKHIYQYIKVPADASSRTSTTGLHGEWPGKDSLASEILPGAPFTWEQLTGKDGGKYVWIGTGMWKYEAGSYKSGVGGSITLDADPNFWLRVSLGEISFKYTWLNTSPSMQPSGGYYKIGLVDLIMLARAYNSRPGDQEWNPACDISAPAGVVGLSDLVVLGLHYGWYWGNYSYNAPYPSAEIANGGP